MGGGGMVFGLIYPVDADYRIFFKMIFLEERLLDWKRASKFYWGPVVMPSFPTMRNVPHFYTVLARRCDPPGTPQTGYQGRKSAQKK
jgi:hypothetical protein